MPSSVRGKDSEIWLRWRAASRLLLSLQQRSVYHQGSGELKHFYLLYVFIFVVILSEITGWTLSNLFEHFLNYGDPTSSIALAKRSRHFSTLSYSRGSTKPSIYERGYRNCNSRIMYYLYHDGVRDTCLKCQYADSIYLCYFNDGTL